MKSLKHLLVQTLALGLATAGAANAATIPVINGGFEQLLVNQSSQFGSAYPSQQVVGWMTSGYNWVYRPGEADTVGGNGIYGNVQLWGPNNGSANGLTAASPLGGNYIAADGAFQTVAIYQQLSGLTPGAKYTVSFAYAGAQQYGFSGPTTDAWVVNLGTAIPTDGERRSNTLPGTAQFTPVLSLANHGFSGWQTASMTFTAQTATDFLSFLAVGTPDGLPPFALLDGVSVTSVGSVPEASTWVMLVAGFGLVGVSARRRSRQAVAA